ncbi:50S ribosomal protein L17 [Candidatus Giovannonibacteria bacterium]|nr:50S ribosomal protein L17 [Candidatus Giovannonibacteria bacterium]
MRHQKKGRKFGRVRKVRRALVKSLLHSLVMREKIKTTEAKAKEIRPMMEKLVTKSRKGNIASAREIIKVIPDKRAAKKLISIIAPKYADRRGGYTRIIKLGKRKSDQAPMVLIEFV